MMGSTSKTPRSGSDDSMKPEFDFELAVRLSSIGAAQTVRLTLVPHEKVDANMRDFLAQVISQFVNVGRQGGFGGRLATLRRSIMGMKGPTVKNNEQLDFSILAENVTPGVWHVLSNVLVSLSHYSYPWKRVSLRAPEPIPIEHLITETGVWRLGYPERPVDLPFELRYELDPGSTYERLIRFELRQELSEGQFERLETGLLAWTELLNGGFPDDDMSPVDCAADAVEAIWSSPTTVDYVIPHYVGGESCFDTLIAMASHWNTDLCPIEWLEIT